MIKAIVADEDAIFPYHFDLYQSVLDMLGFDAKDDSDLKVYDTTEFITHIDQQNDLLDEPIGLRAYRYGGVTVSFVGLVPGREDPRSYAFEYASGALTLKHWCRSKGIPDPEIVSFKEARFASADDALLAYMTKTIGAPRLRD